MNEHYELSWGRKDFSSKKKLFFLANDEFRETVHCFEDDPEKLGGAYSSLSSTYYSIAATAGVHMNNAKSSLPVFFTLPPWVLLGGWCYLRMLPLSNRVVELIGYENMSADECDIRQSILRKRKQYEEAKKCIEYGLESDPSSTSYALLTVGLLKVRLCLGSEFTDLMEGLRDILELMDGPNDIDLHQQIRIYRHAATLAGLANEPSIYAHCKTRAQDIAEDCRAEDQLAKLYV